MALKYKKYLDQKIKDFHGTSILITGANSGIGYEASLALAYKGAHIYMACRNVERAVIAKKAILEEVPEAQIEILLYDQASISSIKKLASKIKDDGFKLDGFVFNAGVYHPKNGLKTEDGFSLTLGTNYVGAKILFENLESYFAQNNTRLVFVGSLANKRVSPRIIYANIFGEKDSLFAQYKISKYCIMQNAYHLSVHNRNNVVAVVHPGVTSTNIINGFPRRFQNAARFVLRAFTHPASKASLTIVYALSESVSSGSYIVPRGLFHIDGYPTISAIPKKIKNNFENDYQEMQQYLKGKF
ncbi:MAG: SDR family NAD(P)-dependent oxidoreductase [Bacilli bacterium]|jgi:NAD(P)-dependent dehydrogenase (short-subunit alcohol dehydrogenase family)